MARTQRKNKIFAKAIAERFVRSYEVGMGLSTAEISRRLGYANSTTIQAIRRGEALPDMVRIAEHIEALKNRSGLILNLHWLITGAGSPFVSSEAKEIERNQISDDIIMCFLSLNHSQQAAFTTLIQSLQ